MNFVYKFSPNHRVSPIKYILLKARDSFLAALPSGPETRTRNVSAAFIVGCGHSGTTLLASRIARSPQVYLHPEETGVFLPAVGSHFSNKMMGLMLSAAEQSHAGYLLEKTPKHVHCVEQILSRFPEAKIICISRNPLDNCASLYKRFGDIDLCIERWNMDNSKLAELVASTKAIHIRFEDLVTKPEDELARVFDYLGLPWNPELLEAGESAYERSGPRNENQEIRFAQIGGSISVNIGSYTDILTDAQVSQVQARTQDISEKLGYASTPTNNH